MSEYDSLAEKLRRIRPETVVVYDTEGESRTIRPTGRRDRWARVVEAARALGAVRAEFRDSEGDVVGAWSAPTEGPQSTLQTEKRELLHVLVEAQRLATEEHRRLLREVADVHRELVRALASRAAESERTTARLLERVQEATVAAAEARAEAASARAEETDVGEVLGLVGALAGEKSQANSKS